MVHVVLLPGRRSCGYAWARTQHLSLGACLCPSRSRLSVPYLPCPSPVSRLYDLSAFVSQSCRERARAAGFSASSAPSRVACAQSVRPGAQSGSTERAWQHSLVHDVHDVLLPCRRSCGLLMAPQAWVGFAPPPHTHAPAQDLRRTFSRYTAVLNIYIAYPSMYSRAWPLRSLGLRSVFAVGAPMAHIRLL